MLSVVVGVELAMLDGRRGCRTAGCVKSSGGDEHSGLSHSGVAVLVSVESRWEAPFKVPYFPFIMWCRSCSSSVHNQ